MEARIATCSGEGGPLHADCASGRELGDLLQQQAPCQISHVAEKASETWHWDSLDLPQRSFGPFRLKVTEEVRNEFSGHLGLGGPKRPRQSPKRGPSKVEKPRKLVSESLARRAHMTLVVGKSFRKWSMGCFAWCVACCACSSCDCCLVPFVDVVICFSWAGVHDCDEFVVVLSMCCLHCFSFLIVVCLLFLLCMVPLMFVTSVLVLLIRIRLFYCCALASCSHLSCVCLLVERLQLQR